MKKTKKISALFISILLVFTLTYCSKDRLEPKAQTLNAYGSLDVFYTTYRPAEQSLVVNRNATGPIIGSHGTKIWVDSTLFMNQNSVDVTYPFTIKLIELYNPKDMILYNMPTVYGGKLLVTGGEIRVRAFKGTAELILKPSKVYTTHVPAPAMDPQMGVFYGQNVGAIVNWTNTPSTSLVDSAGFYQMSLQQMGWINCDYSYTYPPSKSTITFSSTVDDLTNVATFLYFDGIKSVMQVYGKASGDVPVGASVKIVCFAADASGKLFYYTKNLTVGATNAIDVTLTAVTDQALINYLAGL